MKKSGLNHLSLQDIKKYKYGKPYISGFYHYNISHAGDYVVLVYSDNSVGVDIEQIQKTDISHFQKVLSSDENQWIKDTGSMRRFYHVWTRKEAVVKAHGIGLNSRLNQIDTTTNPTFFDDQLFYHKEIDIDSDYVCHVASTSLIEEIEVKYVDFLTDNLLTGYV